MRTYTAFAGAFLITALAWVPSQGQAPPTEATVGLHYGFDFTDGVDYERIGLQGYVGLVGVLGVSATVSHIPGYFDIDGLSSGSGQEAYLMVRVRPWGLGTPLTLGYGALFARTSVTDLIRDVNVTDTDQTDAGVIGLEVFLRGIRPFGELYLLNLLNRPNQVVRKFHFGVSVQLY